VRVAVVPGARIVEAPVTAVTRRQIAAKVPRGYRQLRGITIERDFLEHVGALEEVLALRADARANVLEAAKWMARLADYGDGTTRPTRARICERAGFCISTWKAVRRLLEAARAVVLVEAGTTPEFSSVLHRDDPNTAAVYVLCVPRNTPRRRPPSRARGITRPPSRSRRDRDVDPQRGRLWKSGETPNGPPSGRAQHGAAAGAAAAAVVAVLRQAAGYPISEGWCARIAAPFVRAGYTAADIGWAIEHDPGGARHRHTAAVRYPAGWIRKRLGWWRQHGRPVLPRSQQLAVSRLRSRMDRPGGLGVRLAVPPDFAPPPAAAPADPKIHAAGIRARLGWLTGG